MLRELYMSNNRLETRSTKPIGISLGKNNTIISMKSVFKTASNVKHLFHSFFFVSALASCSLEILDLSWNCIRFTGAIEIARGIKVSSI